MDVIMPQLGETVTEGTVTRWYKKVGDSVTTDEVLFDVETDKVSTEIPAPASGVIREILVQEGVTIKVGARLAVISEPGATSTTRESNDSAEIPTSTAALAPAAPRAVQATKAAADQRLSPVVRRLIAEHGLDPSAIRGSGFEGRITRDDVLALVAANGAASTAPAALGCEKRQPLNAIRKRTRDHLVQSWTTAPHVLQAVEVDFLRVEQARKVAGADWKANAGWSLTYLPFVAHAVASALQRFPLLNASLDGDDLVLHARVNLGIAVDLGFDGLIVPVVKDVFGKTVAQVAREIHDLAQRARENRLSPDDIAGGTYTLSNSGVFGTLITAPIINQPQVAILSTDGVSKKPVVIESAAGDVIAIRPVGVLAQTFDHRAVDGAYSAAYLRELKSILETTDWMKELK